MKVTAESLNERFSSMSTAALSDLYHESELTDLAVKVLKDVVTSRGRAQRLPTSLNIALGIVIAYGILSIYDQISAWTG